MAGWLTYSSQLELLLLDHIGGKVISLLQPIAVMVSTFLTDQQKDKDTGKSKDKDKDKCKCKDKE